MVSWNDAAEMNDCVVRLAFVMPRSNGSAGGRRLLLLLRPLVLVAEDLAIHVLPFEELRLARLHDSNLLQHLLDDHADVLVVDLHALEAVNLLHFVEQILLHRARSLDPQNVVRIDRTLGETVTGAHAVALVHAQVLAGAALRTAAPRASRRASRRG